MDRVSSRVDGVKLDTVMMRNQDERDFIIRVYFFYVEA